MGYESRSAVESPDWVRDSILYEIFPRYFSREGNLEGITRGLPDLESLGVNCLWLMPIHKVGYKFRKGRLGSPYAIHDYFSVDPNYGTKEDLRRLVSCAHSRGMRIIMDLVANHTSRDCPLIRTHPEWYKRDGYGNILSPVPDWYDVAALNYDNHELRAYMLEVVRYWVREFDIDGYRCDVAALVPVDFWVEARRELKAVKPDSILLAESHEPLHNELAFDLTYEESLPGILAGVVHRGESVVRIRDMIERQAAEFPKGALRLRYLENHDQMRAMALIGREAYGVSATLFMTLDGVPLIYNGQEFGRLRKPSLFDPPEEETEPEDPWVLGLYRRLCRVRRELWPLRRGALEFLETDNPRVLAFARGMPQSRAAVVLNFDSIPHEVRLSGLWTGGFPRWKFWFACSGEEEGPRISFEGDGLRVFLPPWEGYILELYHASPYVV